MKGESLSIEKVITRPYPEIIGESSLLKEVFNNISQVAPTDCTTLILGETGTGKELVARAIHQSSSRKNKTMVKLNCAALPANLVESELFGHERGSFTGAFDRRVGKFELADGGSIFLDEIGEMPLELQSKLLRVLQEKEVERIGGKSAIPVNVRIIVATNRDLYNDVLEGRFRMDLYYRLNIFPILLPPLRERREDIPLLANYFIQKFAAKTGKNISKLSSYVLNSLQQYSWPGNVRELEHLLERSVLLASSNIINEVPIPFEKYIPLPNANERKAPAVQRKLQTIEENEREHIIRILKYCNGRIRGENGAAVILGVPPTTLASKIKKLGIKRAFVL